MLFSKRFWKLYGVPFGLLRLLFTILLDVRPVFCIFSSQELEQLLNCRFSRSDICKNLYESLASIACGAASLPFDASNFPSGALLDFLTGPAADFALRFKLVLLVEGTGCAASVVMSEEMAF
jgi:hypothetical protein